MMTSKTLRAWQPEGFTKVANLIGSEMKVAGAILTAVSAVGQVTAFAGDTAAASTAQTMALMQRLSQGINAANALMAPLQQTCASLRAAKAMLEAAIEAAELVQLGGDADAGYFQTKFYPDVEGAAAQAGALLWVPAQIRAALAAANAADHLGWSEIVSCVAGLATAGATLAGAFAAPKGGNGSGADPRPDDPPPDDREDGVGGSSLAGVGALAPGAASPMVSAAAAAVPARAALAAAGAASTAAVGGMMYPPMMGAGAGRGEEERRSGVSWRVTEDDADIFAALPDPTGGVLG